MLFFYAPNYAKSEREIMLNYALGEDYAKLCQIMLLDARDERYESYDEIQLGANSAVDESGEIRGVGGRAKGKSIHAL